MSFEVDRCTSAWAHVALCADLTWASEPPDDFIVANQRLWAQHRRVSQVLQDLGTDSHDKQLAIQENNNCNRRSVKDVIPESRLAQFYGNFYYDDVREKCYTCPNEQPNVRFNTHGCENSDLTECWMLPEVEYWFRKLMDNSDRSAVPRRRRQYKIMADDDLNNGYQSAASGHCGTTSEQTAEEASLEARIRSVRPLWNQHIPLHQSGRQYRTPSPPVSRKIRARRRQPKNLAALAPPPPAYCVDAPTKLFCDPTYKIQFDQPRSSQLTEYQRAMGRLSASVQALMRANASRCPPYRGTNVSRYAPTIPRPIRYPDRRFVWWSREKNQHRNKNEIVNQTQNNITIQTVDSEASNEKKSEAQENENEEQDTENAEIVSQNEETANINLEQKEKIIDDGQLPSTSAEAQEGLKKKRLYSTVLSTSPPPMPNTGIRLTKNINTPGLIRLNPKYGISSRLRTPNVDNKFEELEKEAIEQYKDSDESIDTKFRELEKQAVEQYSTSNSNTSCSSENSGGKKITASKSEKDVKEKRTQKSHKTKSVDSVVIYSQNFPDPNSNKLPHLKNFHGPPRGEKKDLTHRSKSLRISKIESKRAASDTDNETKDTNVKGPKGSKGTMRWTLHVMSPKKRHLTLCVSDFSSEEEIDSPGSIRDAGPCVKNLFTGKVKMSAHGGGDLNPIMRKT